MSAVIADTHALPGIGYPNHLVKTWEGWLNRHNVPVVAAVLDA